MKAEELTTHQSQEIILTNAVPFSYEKSLIWLYFRLTLYRVFSGV